MFGSGEKRSPIGVRGVVAARTPGWKTPVLTLLLMNACSSGTPDRSSSIRRETATRGAAGATQGSAAPPTASATNTAARSHQSVAIDNCPGQLDASVVTALQAAAARSWTRSAAARRTAVTRIYLASEDSAAR